MKSGFGISKGKKSLSKEDKLYGQLEKEENEKIYHKKDKIKPPQA